MEYKTIAEVYGNDISDIIFNYLEDTPWADEEDYTSTSLNLLYLAHSADKLISPLVYRKLNGQEDDDELTSTSKEDIADLINIMYMKNWDKLWAALYADYNPIHNYNMEESETTNEVKNEDTISSGSDNRTVNLSTANTGSNSVADDVYAFNSENASHDKKSTETVGTTESNTGTDNRALSNTTNYDTDNEITRGLTRQGNIGVTTSQQLIESELKLRANKFFDIVFSDIDKLLTLSIY